MTSYPQGGFVQEFAERTLRNIGDIRYGRALEAKDTALISFLLAVFVLPHERIDEGRFMAELLAEYPGDLGSVIKIVRKRERTCEEPDAGLLPQSLDELPRYLRNAISHFNIRPESADGREFTHLLVWNRVPDNRRHGRDAGRIDFVARVHVERLRKLVVHVLRRMSEREVGDRYDSVDPIAEFDRQQTTPRSTL